jgi:PAS domain S-box-containing protein
MTDNEKSREQLVHELTELRSQNAALEKSITGYISAELAAEESSRYAENIVETVREPLLVLDGNLKIISANRNFYRTFKVTPAETIGSFIYDLGNKQWDIPKLRELLETILPQKATFDNYEVEHNFASIGRRIMLLNARQIERVLGKERIILLAISDITERKQAEARLSSAMADLERSNKDLEQFAYVASHDLQEPLRMVSSYTQLLAQHYDGRLDEKAKKFMDYAVDGAVRMQRLINDLLTYSRIGTQGKPMETTDTHALLGEAIRNLAAMIEEKRAIITNDDLPTVKADASQLIQVFQNLISNAIKFQGEDVPHIHVSAQDKGREWIFSIRDNGIGIEKHYADRVFVIFQRLHTRREYPGTGIGLAVCKRIVERHGGRIWFESEPGKGSTFFFTIMKAKEVCYNVCSTIIKTH